MFKYLFFPVNDISIPKKKHHKSFETILMRTGQVIKLQNINISETPCIFAHVILKKLNFFFCLILVFERPKYIHKVKNIS